jgi:LytS/YehU family sensor histidine kinase
VFYGLEQIEVFPDSGYFHPRITTLDSLTGEYLAGLLISVMFNFGFCGLRFFEINLRMREELSRSRLQMLQGQINPHFMFNVLNHVHVLIRKEPELADSLLLQYTDILRYQLYSGDKETIPINQEVQFLGNFVDVEAVRWRGKLDINCRWEVDNPDMEIPPLLFITFVENAFKHVSRSNTQKGYVNIMLVQTGKTIVFEIQNSNVDPAPSKKEDSGIGLANIKRRLDILFPGKYSLETDSNELYYYTKLTVNG